MTKFTDVRGCLTEPIDRDSVLLFKQRNLCSPRNYSPSRKISALPLSRGALGTAFTCAPVWHRAVNRQPGPRSATRRDGRPRWGAVRSYAGRGLAPRHPRHRSCRSPSFLITLRVGVTPVPTSYYSPSRKISAR